MMRLLLTVALALTGCATAGDAPINAGPVLDASNADRIRAAGGTILFWNQQQRDANFPAMERLFPGHVVEARGPVRALSPGAPLPLPASEVDAIIESMNIAGIIILDRGKIRLERYARGHSAAGRWTSFSVAKSFTSTLVGAAIRDGHIASVADPVTRYIPELAGSAYDGVTVRQLLTMTSGVRWNENYTDPKSDVVRMYAEAVPAGVDPTVAYMRTLPRETVPGTKWVYKTGETNLIGVLVAKATGRPLANYMSEKIAGPAGFERDGFWMVDQSRQEIGGCCLSLALRDYARMGQFVLEDGRGQTPAGWFADALGEQAAVGRPGYAYGYQWWVYPHGSGGQGIFGQSLYIDRANGIVIVTSSAWPKATGPELWAKLRAFDDRVVAAIVAERR